MEKKKPKKKNQLASGNYRIKRIKGKIKTQKKQNKK